MPSKQELIEAVVTAAGNFVHDRATGGRWSQLGDAVRALDAHSGEEEAKPFTEEQEKSISVLADESARIFAWKHNLVEMDERVKELARTCDQRISALESRLAEKPVALEKCHWCGNVKLPGDPHSEGFCSTSLDRLPKPPAATSAKGMTAAPETSLRFRTCLLANGETWTGIYPESFPDAKREIAAAARVEALEEIAQWLGRGW